MFTESDKLGLAERDKVVEVKNISPEYVFKLETLDDLLKRDEQREQDGFKKKIKLGKFSNPQSKKGSSDSVIVVPTTEEEKLLHSPFNPEVEDETGGEGEGEEGDTVGEQPIDSDDGEGDEGEEGEGGAGTGSGGDHGLSKEMYETGKILTEQFNLPNIQDKGKKVAIPEYKYDLTDTNNKSGQLLDKQKTLKEICKTNIMLGNLDKDSKDTKDLVVRPDDKIYRTLSRERMYESQAVVFFCRDYSGSMHGDPTKVAVKQHLMIYSWLMYQYSNKVIPRFIVHDTEAKEVENFEKYFKSKLAGGTVISSGYKLINDIIEEESLERDYNIYVLHGTDGDNLPGDSQTFTDNLAKMLSVSNRIGITVARNNWGGSNKTQIEEDIAENFVGKHNNLRVDSFKASEADDDKIIESIKYLMEEV